MRERTTPGFYIVGEGNDGTGKSTQIDMLAEHLASEYELETYVMHEPDGSPISSAIRDVIKNGSLERDPVTNLLLFTASRHETWNREAKPVLERGGVVLSARNELSTQIYQGIAEGLGADYVRTVTAQFMDERYIHPDLTVIFKLFDTAIRQQRIAARGELENPDTFESRGDEFQRLLDSGYEWAAQEYGYPIIDAGGSREQVQQRFRSLALRAMIAKGILPSDAN